MTAEPLVALCWLVAAHLVADFVLQTDGMATEKFGRGRSAWLALARHILAVAASLLPLVVVFGMPGLAFVALTALSHAAIDRAKVALTRRVEPALPGGGEPSAEDAAAGPPLDRAWTPVPGALFMLDQVAHVAVLLAGWAVLLAGAPVVPAFAAAVDGILGATDRELFHRLIVTSLVLVSLVIVNVRAASLFVGVLVRAPLESGRPRPGSLDPLDPGSVVSRAAQPNPAPPTAYTVRVGPLSGRLEPDREGSPPVTAGPVEPRRSLVSPARVGEAIGVLERLLIVGLVLAGAVASIGLVIAAKTLARFKQLDDREFAEYYLLGTLASVSIAVLSALVAQAVLAAL